jgi:hypothetical protein
MALITIATKVRDAWAGQLAALDGATAFLLMEKNAKGKQTEFWDQHSLGEQPCYNIICSLYGDSPKK